MSCRILVVDDDQPTREALEAILRRAGYQVTPLAAGVGLEECLARESYDAAVVDYHLPDCTGVDVAQALKARLPGCRVVLISSEAFRGQRSRELPPGVDRFLPKPFSKHDILHLLTELCPLS